MRHSLRDRIERPVGTIMRRRLAAAAALGAACLACGDGPNEVEKDEVCPTASVRLCTDPLARSAAQDGASDAVSRSTPALENAAGRAALATNLGQLSTQLAAGNITQARQALSRSREATTIARGQLASFPGDAADLAAIELLLDQVASLLGMS